MTGSGVEYRANPRFVPDNVSIKFGTDGDSRLYYDGSDLVVSPAVVGNGNFKVSGASLLLDSGEMIDFGAGDVMLTHAAAQLQINGGDLIVTDGEGLVVGHTAQITGVGASGATPEVQILGTAGGGDAGGVLAAFSADAFAGRFIFFKSRDASLAGNTVVQDGDELGHIEFAGADGVDFGSAAAQISALVDGAPGAGDMPGRLEFRTTPNGAQSPAERMRIDSAGGVFIGDTANANMTVGLTINQGANDDQILSFKSSDVGHALVGTMETDTFARFVKQNSQGGLQIAAIQGINSTGSRFIGLDFFSIGRDSDTAKSTAAFGAIVLNTAVHDGANTRSSIGTNGNMVVIRDGNSGATRYIFDIEGSAHADIEWTTYDNYDDLALIADIESELLLREDGMQTGRRHVLEATGIIGKDSWHFENGKPRAMVNTTRLAMLHHGALIQVADRFNEYDARIAGLEKRLLAAGA